MSEQLQLLAPTNGEIIPLSKVQDQVFSKKALGDGFGLEPNNGQIKAPVTGQIVMVAETKHAIGIKTTDGVELLLHLGIDTVELKGKPFKIFVEQGNTVHKGDPIGSMDLKAIKNASKSTTVIVTITNTDEILDNLTLNVGIVHAGDIAATANLKAIITKTSSIKSDNDENKFHKTARLVIEAIGGKKNINSVIHCFTRLRFSLKDDTIPQDKMINDIPGVLDVARANDQYQVVIGQTVDDVYDEVISQLGSGFEPSEDQDESIKEPVDNSLLAKLKHGFSQLISIITGSMMPVIGLLAASGMLKGVLNIMTNFGHMSTTSSTYIIINAMADSAFYFLPVIVGFTAAKKLGSNSIVVALIACFLIYPDLVKIVSSGKFNYYIAGVGINATFLGIPVHIAQYTSSIFPMIFAAWMAAKIEPWIKKWMPVTLRLIFTPLIEIFLVGMTVLLVVGPLLTFASEEIANCIQWLLNLNTAISGMILAGTGQILVIFGLHWGLMPLVFNDFALRGHSMMASFNSIAMIAQGAGALAVWVKTHHNPDLKGLSLSAAISAAVGITEPAVYGVNLKYGRVFITSCIGAAIGGLVNGLLKVDMYGFTGSLIGFPSFVPKAGQGNPNNLLYFWIASVVTIIAAFTLTYLFGYKEKDIDNLSV